VHVHLHCPWEQHVDLAGNHVASNCLSLYTSHPPRGDGPTRDRLLLLLLRTAAAATNSHKGRAYTPLAHVRAGLTHAVVAPSGPAQPRKIIDRFSLLILTF
jgi:hypothetical protein